MSEPIPAGNAPTTILDDLQARFGGRLVTQVTNDHIPTVWAGVGQFRELLRYLKTGASPRYPMLYDLTAIDERMRTLRGSQPPSDFTMVYTLLSFDRADFFRVKVALLGETPSLPTITDLWPMANWYEREVWDMFGIRFDGHSDLRRIIMPYDWEGHPLRKDYPLGYEEVQFTFNFDEIMGKKPHPEERT